MARPMAEPASPLGRTLGHYRIVEKIGEGGMGEVYRALDEHLGCDVAIKVLPPGAINDESARQRFHKEARVLARLNHPNIAIVHDFDTQQGIDYLVMEYIPGTTLSQKLATARLAEKEIIRLGAQLAEGLSAAHEHGVIHRDLKPSNLRLTTDGRLKILDFGLAKLRLPATASAATESMTEAQVIAGTLPYMAPEQLLDREIDVRTDIHAAGSVLYEMATGQRPFSEVQRSQLIGAILSRSPSPPSTLHPHLSRELEWIILKCLEKEPENRYQSAKELTVDLRRLERQSETEPVPSAIHAEVGLFFSRRSRSVKLRSRSVKLMVLAIVLGLVVVGLFLPTLRQGRGGSSEIVPRFRALAVLPLVDLSGDPARAYFADGMTEELITQLGKVTSARVISRQSVMQFKGTKIPLTEIAQKLRVDAVVEGSVLQSGNRVRVTARLVDAAAEKPVWTEEYERDLRDVLSLQDEVTRAIANEIKVTIGPREQARLAKPREINPEAYEAYLKGRFQWYKISRQGLDDATRYFQLALEKDPNYALAYAGLADVWMMRADSGYAAPSETLPEAKAAALKALQLDGTLSEAYVSLGNIEAGYERDWAAAGRDFRRAIELNPNSVDAHFMYADYLISIRHNQEWQSEIQQAVNLDPMNFFLRCFYGWHLVYLGRYDEAIGVMQKVVATQPNFSSAHMGLWGAYYRKHMEKEALGEAVKFFEALNDKDAVAALTSGYQEGGYRAGMRRAAEVLAARAQHSHVAGVRIARLYAHAGETDRALAWLQKAYEARETPLVHLGVGWDWDQLRSYGRFQELVRRMNFPR